MLRDVEVLSRVLKLSLAMVGKYDLEELAF